MLRVSFGTGWAKWLILVIIITALIIGVARLFGGAEDGWIKDNNGNWVMHGNPEIKDFESCSKKYPVMESYPERCAIPNGPMFIKQY